jgi:acyl-CoA synthetase (AMP-forming)/AMP-acid ligase II
MAITKVGSVGVLLPNLESRIVSNEDGVDVDAKEGEPGELWIRGPTVMKVGRGFAAWV